MKEYLKKLYEEFKKTNDIYIKGYIWSVLSNFTKYFDTDEEIKKMFNDVSIACQLLKDNIKENDTLSLREQNEFLINNTDLISLIPSDIYLYSSDLDKKKHSQVGLFGLLESFLYSLSGDLLNFYKEMKNTGRIIILNKGKSNGYTGFISIDNKDNFICINKFETFDDLKVLVHEIGHAYYNYFNNITLTDTKDLSLMVKSEIPAMWIEMLFHVYLRRYHNIKCRIKHIKNFNDLMNCFGLYATSFLQIGNQDRNIEDMYRFIFETDYRQLVNPMINSKSLKK